MKSCLSTALKSRLSTALKLCLGTALKLCLGTALKSHLGIRARLRIEKPLLKEALGLKLRSILRYFWFFILAKIFAKIGPETLCQKLNKALGTAAIGLKCAAARAAPKPEFCIPTSIAIALLSAVFSLNNFAARKPTK